jgi:hypothetical protein
MMHWIDWLCCNALLLAVATSAEAQTPTQLDQLQLSGDVHHALPASGGGSLTSPDEALSRVDTSTDTAASVPFPAGLDSADLDAFHAADACGPALYSLDTMALVAGTVMFAGDVFTEAGAKVFDSRAEGLHAGVNLDAVSRDPSNCGLVFSTDVMVQLSGMTFRPNDLISRQNAGSFSLFRAGDFNGNIDALHLLSTTRWLLSVSGHTDLGGTIASSQTVIELDVSGPVPQYLLSFVPSELDPSWLNINLDALWALPGVVPELIFIDGFE